MGSIMVRVQMSKRLIEKREEARNLRREGFALNEIVEKIGVAKSTTSLWVRDIVLTQEQKKMLWEKNPISMHSMDSRERANKASSETWKTRRMESQERGRERAKTQDVGFIAGCMLYWAEGSKKVNSAILTNMDVAMMKTFVSFLRAYFGIKDDEIRMTIRCYSKGEMSVVDIENFWMKSLELPESCLCRTEVDHDKRPSSGKVVKSPYGICRIEVHQTEVVQQIYGAIQEYGGFEEKKWIG